MATVTTNELAAAIGKTVEGNKPVSWAPVDLVGVHSYLTPLAAQRPVEDEGLYVLDGITPGWLGVAFVHGVHPQHAALNDPRIGQVRIPNLIPNGAGSSHLIWTVTHCAEYTLIQFEVPGGVFDVDDLPNVIPPEVDGKKGVLLNGKGPNWLTAALAMAYHAFSRWVATFQPASPPHIQPPTAAQYVVAMTHWPKTKLGSTISNEEVQKQIAA